MMTEMNWSINCRSLYKLDPPLDLTIFPFTEDYNKHSQNNRYGETHVDASC
jgi:hypothetical protein